MSQVLFYTGTKAQYDALASKNANALYFLTDTGRLFRGSTPYSYPVSVVTSFPASGETGVIYVNSGTHEAKTWNGTAWTVLALATITSIGSNPTDSQLPTAKAVKNYVDGQITQVSSGVSGAVANVSYSNKSISVQKGSGTPVTTALTGFVDGASYNGTSGVLSFTTNGGTPISVNLPVENFLSAASFDGSTNVLTLTLTGGETVTCNLADLVDAYTGGSGATVTVSVSGGVITATANISSDSGNILQAKSNGLYASVPIAGDSGNILQAKSGGLYAAVEWGALGN